MTPELPSQVAPPDLVAMSDEDLVRVAGAGGKQALDLLMARYSYMAASAAAGYFLVGADREDLVQEGLIGLFKAIRNFSPATGTPFRAFARMCVQRQIITAVKTATRQKHIPLNGYVSLSKPLQRGESGRTLIEVLRRDYVPGPEDVLIMREEFDRFEQTLGEILTEREWRVLMGHLDPRLQTYGEIAREVGCSWKAVDNALQRAKRKLERYLRERKMRERQA